LRKTGRITMARAPDPIDRFARFLAQSEHSPLTIKNYRSDLDAFAAWFQSANGEPMEPAKITPTDLRQFKRWLIEQRRLKPNTVNRKLATLKSFLTWAARAGLANSISTMRIAVRSHGTEAITTAWGSPCNSGRCDSWAPSWPT